MTAHILASELDESSQQGPQLDPLWFGTLVHASFGACERGEPPNQNSKFQGPDLDDIEFSHEEVRERLSHLKANSSSGPDCIYLWVVLNSSDSLALLLYTVFQNQLTPGDSQRTGKQVVVAIYKKGYCQSPSSYRPVCLPAVPLPSKVLESFVHDNLLQRLLETGALTNDQHGLLPRQSCTCQLLEVMDDWTGLQQQRIVILSMSSIWIILRRLTRHHIRDSSRAVVCL